MGDTLRSIVEGMRCDYSYDSLRYGPAGWEHDPTKCPKCRLEALLAEHEKVDLVKAEARAGMREACAKAAKDWHQQTDDYYCRCSSCHKELTDSIERNLTPVFEALRISVIEECKKVVCDISQMYEKKNEGRVRIAESHEWSAFFICLALDELKGAPR